ncbi:MAG: hypothetical protein V3U84_02415 [Thiotrichaceae bacterium]
MMNRITQLFPLWAILLSCAGYYFPESFTSLKPAIIPLLSLIMFGMGISLKPADFSRVLKRPKLIAIGITLQFLLMPFYAWGISTLEQLLIWMAIFYRFNCSQLNVKWLVLLPPSHEKCVKDAKGARIFHSLG